MPPSTASAQASWDPPAVGTVYTFSGDPKSPITVVRTTETSVHIRWGKRPLEAVGLFHVRDAGFLYKYGGFHAQAASIFPLEVGKRVEWVATWK